MTLQAIDRVPGGRPCWFVGASYGGVEDQTARFVREGIWDNGLQDKYAEIIRSIQPGDRIAIKSSYTRKRDLPFDNHGHTVSVLAIKATGTVRENPGDGHHLEVDWTPTGPPREWYFYTNRTTVWRVLPGDWFSDALIDFAFHGAPQDIDRFRHAPAWRTRFGEAEVKFGWSAFYEAIATALLQYRNQRDVLVAKVHDIASRVGGLANLDDQYGDGSVGPLRDIDPFTTIGIFNRGITEANRKTIAKALAEALGVSEPVPDSFDGLPILNNQRSWFFGYERHRKQDDIDALWSVFEQALRFADSEGSDTEETRSAFVKAYDDAASRYGVRWNLTMGLYWSRPWTFATLDLQSRNYIKHKLRMTIGLTGPKGACSGSDYLSVIDSLHARFPEDSYPVHSFPELSFAAWVFKDNTTDVPDRPGVNEEGEMDGEEEVQRPPLQPYSIEQISQDGCFVPMASLEEILARLHSKKNLILQGPPGTGKTWLARRLAFALIGQRDESKIRALQFHPNLSYEDFVRGWRPRGDGKLALIDGPFLEAIDAAIKDATSRYVVVIEEINRGNPAQIFGELLTLLETDKRTPDEALELSYSKAPGERVFVPKNLYVIGTMNVADRSLALVDFALRRRFAFVNLEPSFGSPWKEWLVSKFGVPIELVEEMEQRIVALNDSISSDHTLGPQFRIGHSYLTPATGADLPDARKWFRQVVETEIGPLLEEILVRCSGES